METNSQSNTNSLPAGPFQGTPENLAVIFESVGEAIIVQDRQFTCVYANHLGAQLCGFSSAQDIRNVSVTQMIGGFEIYDEHGGPLPSEKLPARRVLFGGESVATAKLRVKNLKTGRETWSSVTARAISDSEGRPTHAVSVFRDITKEIHDRQNIEQTATRFAELADALPHKIFTTGPDGVMNYCNRQWTEYTGQTVASRDVWSEAFHPDDFKKLVPKWWHSVQTGEAFQMEYRLRRASDGAYRWMWARAIPVRSTNGNIIQWIGSLTDVHEQKQSALELERAKQEAEAANQAKSMFLANMSHEIRTPLNAILGFSDLLRDPEVSVANKQKFLDIITRSGRSLLTIIDDILDLSKVEAGRLYIEKRQVVIRDLVHEVMALFSVSLADKDVKLTVSADSSVPREIDTDPIRVRQILVNLVGNAIKFTAQGSVRVHLETAPGNVLRFIIEDTGKGISKQHQATLFQSFSQGETSAAREFGGTGLGLALSRRLAMAMGGNVLLEESEIGVGSKFVFWIECRPSAAKTEASKATADSTGTGSSRSLQDLRILMAEDSVDNQFLVRMFLEPLGAVLAVVGNGQAAVDMALEMEPDLILMDMQMPIMSGFEATKKLRAMGFKKPILALTAYALIEEQQRCLAAGCDAHITKPIDREHLVDVIWKFRKGEF